jgi:hypothetical protein
LLLLGCSLVLLFPVVSATDDLHAMRPEMEEWNASKRVLKQAGSTRTSAWTHSSATFLAWSGACWFGQEDQVCGLVWSDPETSPKFVIFSQQNSRAPPSTSL